MILRNSMVVLLAAMLAVAAAVLTSAFGPKEAEAAATVKVTGCTGTSVTLDATEKQMLDLHNKKRASMGMSKLCVHPALQRAAEKHSRDMIDKDYFSHTSRDGTTFAQRIKREGYAYRIAGENIAWGSGSLGSPDSIFKSWMNSPGHKANILNKNFKEIGVGVANGTYKSYNNAAMWTADFGAR